MKKIKTQLLAREQELAELQEFIDSPNAGVVFVRGRRRIGKSTLLLALQTSNSNIFYFSGILDQTSVKTILDFARSWDSFTQFSSISNLRNLSWKIVFNQMSHFFKQKNKKQKSTVLIFDEIQWIAKTKSGCIGAIKEAYLDWEKYGVKIILCGSSNKFFEQKSGGDETILRGMRTRSDIWVHPFKLQQVKQFYFPKWKDEEVALIYMFLGGVPYYLNRIENAQIGFMHSLNKAIFSKETIFLEEVDEVLRLEFNERGLTTVKKILGALGENGKTQSEIALRTGISKSTLSQIIDRLCDYGILYIKTIAHKKNLNEAGVIYYLKDFYLRFYFQVLSFYKDKIENNVKGLLFAQLFHGQQNQYYIPTFSGKAFEMLVRSILLKKDDLSANIFTLLNLVDCDYEILDYWDSQTQIDLIVEHKKDRIARIIECKWVGLDNHALAQYVRETKQKKYTPIAKYSLQYFLIISKNISNEIKSKALKNGVTIITLADLF